MLSTFKSSQRADNPIHTSDVDEVGLELSAMVLETLV